MTDTGIDGYRDYLARRDGEADLLNRRLASREEFFEGLQANPRPALRRRGTHCRPVERAVPCRTPLMG